METILIMPKRVDKMYFLDASWRFGAEVNPFTNMFLNFRYLGGGATGTGDPDFPGDGYVKNWLHFFNVSAGFVLKL